jgi:bacterioferritin-associated ferredoxin
MIICSCNFLSDHEVRNVVRALPEQSLSTHQVYERLGCTVQCGRCARTIKRIIIEASTASCAEVAAIEPTHALFDHQSKPSFLRAVT